MNYPAMRYVASEDCKVKGPGRALLWVIAYHADRDTGECWVGQRRLARESGLARATVQRALDKLFADGVLEPIEDHQGPKPERYQIAPGMVEGWASATGVVEGSTSVSASVEGQAVAGEVIHNPASSGLAASPLEPNPFALLDSSMRASGLAQRPAWSLVDSLSESSGLLLTRSPAETAPKGLKQVSITSREEHVVGDADSTADAAGVADAREPPPIDPKVLDELERRGLRGNPRPPPKPEQQPRPREEQLAILERQIAEDEAKAKNGQEGRTSA